MISETTLVSQNVLNNSPRPCRVMQGESEENMKLTYEEKDLLEKLILNGIGNGNTVNPNPFTPTPEQYKILYSIMNKLDKEQAAG